MKYRLYTQGHNVQVYMYSIIHTDNGHVEYDTHARPNHSSALCSPMIVHASPTLIPTCVYIHVHKHAVKPLPCCVVYLRVAFMCSFEGSDFLRAACVSGHTVVNIPVPTAVV